jgi:DegV family protein with EDD domain
MTERIAIVTDSVACIPQEMVKQYGIKIVPIQLIIEDKAYRDGIDITPDEFYNRLRRASKPPTSAGAVPGAFIEVFRKVSRRADFILCITISAKFSGMYNSAREAGNVLKETLKGVEIELFDSGTAAAAQGLIVLAAALAAVAGKSRAEVISVANKVSQKVYLLGILDELNYLAKSGRIPKVAAMAGYMLSIKPIFALKDGEAYPVANSRSIPSGLTRILEIVAEETKKGKPLHIAVMHADALEQATSLKDRIAARFDCTELFITEFTPVMGAHTGPGVIAVAYYNEE